MKYVLKSDIQTVRFLQTVDKCRGEVFFENEEGNRLNLKSQLCKYVFLSLEPGEIRSPKGRVCCNKEDALLLVSFLERPDRTF